MKKLFVLASIAIAVQVSAQTNTTTTTTTSAGTPAAEGGQGLPDVAVKTIDGKLFRTGKIENGGKPIIISFWATWCKPCKKELDAIAEEYEEWQKETGVKLVAISIDDARSASKVAPDVKSKGWEYEVYLDENSDFKRAMNVNNVPHTFIIDGSGKIVWQHNSYAEGDEHHLLEAVRKVARGEKP